MVGNDNVIDWLLDNTNSAVEYRTRIELLDEKAENSKVIDLVNKRLPDDWQETKGLWLTYYYTLIAECGLNKNDLKINKTKLIKRFNENLCEFGCGDFMMMRALVMLGFDDELQNIIGNLKSEQLPDGGYLCSHRVKKLTYTPKSCIKSNNLALMFCAECKKRKIKLSMEKNLLSYFWKHNLFYKSTDLSTLVLNGKENWRTIDTFFPFEVMRVGIQNIIESLCALGYGSDKKLTEAWKMLYSKRNNEGKYVLSGTLTKSYLPKETVGKPSKWVTFYALLAEKEKMK
jgi:hypothetical protein